MQSWFDSLETKTSQHHKLAQDEQNFVLSPYISPVLHVKPGDFITVDTADASNKTITSKRDLPSQAAKWPFTNPCVGPVFIEGVEPGDTLVVDIIEIKPLVPWAASWIRVNLGSLQGNLGTAMISPPLQEEVWIYDIEDGSVYFNANKSDLKVKMKYEPSLGTIGLAPRMEALHTITAGSYGGNMDCKETQPGSRLLFNVNVEGALLYWGDAHALQGDGEISGSSVEMQSTVTLQIGVIKGKKIGWPRIINDDYIMTVGCGRPLEDAFRVANKELINWLVEDYEISLTDAYKLLENSGLARVGNVVNPNYAIVSKIPRSIVNQLKLRK